jgi:hypothetical protein
MSLVAPNQAVSWAIARFIQEHSIEVLLSAAIALVLVPQKQNPQLTPGEKVRLLVSSLTITRGP